MANHKCAHHTRLVPKCLSEVIGYAAERGPYAVLPALVTGNSQPGEQYPASVWSAVTYQLRNEHEILDGDL